MKTNSRMTDLFRATTDVLLITAIVGLAAASSTKTTKEASTHIEGRDQQMKRSHPGQGGVAVITVDAEASGVDVDGRRMAMAELLQGGQKPETYWEKP